MEPSLREMIRAACEQDDAARDRYDRFERKWAERERAQAPREIIRKTYTPPPQQSAPTMTREAQQPWDEWLAKSFANLAVGEREWVMARLETVIEVMAEESAKALKEQVEKLREEIASLRCDITILQGIVKGQVTELKDGNRDAA